MSVGDRAIVAVAQALKASVRVEEDVVARIGGDEFAILVANFPVAQLERRLAMLATMTCAPDPLRA